MPSATLTSKGQITIPAAVRAGLNLRTGDRIEFVETAHGHYEIMAKTCSVMDLKSIVPKPEKTVSIEEMNLAISRMGSEQE